MLCLCCRFPGVCHECTRNLCARAQRVCANCAVSCVSYQTMQWQERLKPKLLCLLCRLPGVCLECAKYRCAWARNVCLCLLCRVMRFNVVPIVPPPWCVSRVCRVFNCQAYCAGSCVLYQPMPWKDRLKPKFLCLFCRLHGVRLGCTRNLCARGQSVCAYCVASCVSR